MNWIDILTLTILSGHTLLMRSAGSGFRDLLDPGSAEWHNTSVEEKIEIVWMLYEVGISFPELCLEYQSRYVAAGRPDIAADCPNAIEYLLKHLQ